MQIRVLPPSPHPAILFTIAYPEQPEYLGIPTAWAAQLYRLSADELEMPQTLLALDKASWLIAVLQSVTFDVSGCGRGQADGKIIGIRDSAGRAQGTFSCVFTDGKTVEWELGSSFGVVDSGRRKDW